MGRKFDFSGWATKNNLRCSDGRTIRKDAFKGNDGQTVPLVWQHQHDDPTNVLGHALLENRDEGVYTYCTFNDTAKGQHAKALVEHGDVVALSIYANQLQQRGGDVLHGAITVLQFSIPLVAALRIITLPVSSTFVSNPRLSPQFFRYSIIFSSRFEGRGISLIFANSAKTTAGFKSLLFIINAIFDFIFGILHAYS